RGADLPDSHALVHAKSPPGTTARTPPATIAVIPTKPAPPRVVEGEKPAFKWPAELLHEGKIPAPDLGKLTRRVHHDYSVAKPRDHEHHGYEKGVYFVKSGVWTQAGLRDELTSYACQVVGRATGAGVWRMVLVRKEEKRSLSIDLNRDGGLRIMSASSG